MNFIFLSASLFKLFEPFLGKKSIQYANKAEGKSRRKSYLRALGPSHLHYHYSGIQTVGAPHKRYQYYSLN